MVLMCVQLMSHNSGMIKYESSWRSDNGQDYCVKMSRYVTDSVLYCTIDGTTLKILKYLNFSSKLPLIRYTITHLVPFQMPKALENPLQTLQDNF